MAPARKTIQEGNQPKEFEDQIGQANAKRFEFSAEGRVQVKVKVKHGKKARAKKWTDSEPPSQPDFTLTRRVMNLEVPGGADEIELDIYSDDASETKMAYFFNNRWNIISQVKKDGYFSANVKNWPSDPEIGIGH